MRKGALMTGKNTCSSTPVDILGIQFVLPKTCNNWEKVCLLPPTQFRAISRLGQPKRVFSMSLNCPELIRNCEFLRMGLTPTSINGATATGPAMVIRYSRLVTKLRSQPGKTICSNGMGMVYLGQSGLIGLPQSGLLGSFGTTEPSGLVSAMTPLLGRKATGVTERMSNPRKSFSPPV